MSAGARGLDDRAAGLGRVGLERLALDEVLAEPDEIAQVPANGRDSMSEMTP